METAENSSKISNAQRILRIVEKMSAAKMNVVVRSLDDSGTGIRGTLAKVILVKQKRYVQIMDVSSLGLEKLQSSKLVKVEVLGMPSRVMFKTVVAKVYPSHALVVMPKQMISTERRANARYTTTENLKGFYCPDGFQPTQDEITAAPLIAPYEKLAAWSPIVDMSIGGMCVMGNFYALTKFLEGVEEDIEGKLQLPMSPPLPMKVVVRWRKKTINRLIEGGADHGRLEYRFGMEFVDPSEEDILKIRQFMRQLSLAQAI